MKARIHRWDPEHWTHPEQTDSVLIAQHWTRTHPHDRGTQVHRLRWICMSATAPVVVWCRQLPCRDSLHKQAVQVPPDAGDGTWQGLTSV